MASYIRAPNRVSTEVCTVSRILVVDDDRDIRSSMRMALEMEGYTVLEAANGRTALDILRRSVTPLVVMLDLRMPVMDGLALLRAVESDPDLVSYHAFVLVTANYELEWNELPEVVARMHVPILRKPFDLDDLIDTVSAVCARLQDTGSSSGYSAHTFE